MHARLLEDAQYPHWDCVRMTVDRFVALLERCAADGPAPDGKALFDELHTLYSGDGRRYHTPAHLDHCLAQFDMCRHLMQRPDEVEMALWYHDAVYEPAAHDNELRSAELFATRLGHVCPEEMVTRVYDLILATTHREPPRDQDTRLMVDIDLSGFALPWEEFARESEAVRAEFGHLSDEEFYASQMRFLRSLVERARFYSSDFFHQRYEDQARENVTRTLRQLTEAGFA